MLLSRLSITYELVLTSVIVAGWAESETVGRYTMAYSSTLADSGGCQLMDAELQLVCRTAKAAGGPVTNAEFESPVPARFDFSMGGEGRLCSVGGWGGGERHGGGFRGEGGGLGGGGGGHIVAMPSHTAHSLQRSSVLQW